MAMVVEEDAVASKPNVGNSYDAVVCVPTFRRPAQLRKTLGSLAEQVGGVRFAVVVVDNDAMNPAGKAVADEFFAQRRLNGFCVVESRQGNCFAINSAFSTARATYEDVEYFLMIDDDEIAAPSWLAEMVSAARDHDADLAGGPVLRVFDGDPERWATLHPLFNSPPTPTGFVAALFGSGNCLIRRRVFEALDEPDFDLRFNFLGGGDAEFFQRCRRRGLRAYWNCNAIAVESVPAQRMDVNWLISRGVATGVINYTIDRKRNPDAIGYFKLLGKNLISLGLSLGRAASLYRSTRHWAPACHPICVSVGRTLGAFGFAPAPYKG
jgi:glycosyltransferase involved in cell wall biosynthesis